MSNLTEQLKQSAGHAMARLSQGWLELKERAGGALTPFRHARGIERTGEDELPVFGSWGFMAADVAERDDSVVVRLEAPGMSRSDFKLELRGDTLCVQGEKQVEREFEGEGHRTIQCAYGAFRRDVPLPVAVHAEKAKATYRDGVLRVVLPKVEGARPRRLTVKVT